MMVNTDMGKQLKSLAKPTGSFVDVHIQSVYDLLDTLAVFFYSKKHEWVAVCFLDEQHRCRRIWFNKGPNHQNVTLLLSPQQALEVGGQIGTKSIILAHNHPMSSQDIPDYGIRRLNIQASYIHKASILGFSDPDIALAASWRGAMQTRGVSYAHAVFVAGTFMISGDDPIIDNYNVNKPKMTPQPTSSGNCFIATEVFGGDATETQFLREYRDIVLLQTQLGRTACRAYYRLSPLAARWLRKHPRGRPLVAALLRSLIARMYNVVATRRLRLGIPNRSVKPTDRPVTAHAAEEAWAAPLRPAGYVDH